MAVTPVFRKDDGTVNISKTARHFQGHYLEEFIGKERRMIEEKGALGNPLMLFVLYEEFLRQKVIETNPGLCDAYNVPNETRIAVLVRRLMPEFPQFIASWLDRFETVPPTTPSVTTVRGLKGGRDEIRKGTWP